MTVSNIFHCRPEPGEREAVEEACYEFLDALSINFQRVDHDIAPTMVSLEPVEKMLGCEIAKNLFLTNRQQSEFYLLIMPGSKAFKTKYLSAQLNCSRLSFATEEHLRSILGVEPGCASVLALLNDREKKVHLVLDRDLEKSVAFACHPCRNSSTVSFAYSRLIDTIIPALGHSANYVNLPDEPQ